MDRNLNAFKSMRDHIHPPRLSAPSCIVPPTKEMVVRPYLVLLLPIFMVWRVRTRIHISKNLRRLATPSRTTMDLMRLKLFPFTLKDKAKIWLNSLRPRTIRNWTEMQAEFLKKFFSTHKTNSLKRQIFTFSGNENEKFYACWERYMEALDACPYHRFDT